jgi:D-alanyl-D-alanine carboxypeptidase
MFFFKFILVFLLMILNLSCINKNSMKHKDSEQINESVQEKYYHFYSILPSVLAASYLPQNNVDKIQEITASNPAFIIDLLNILQEEPFLWILVDKEHPLPAGYEPDDLTELMNGSYRVNREGLMLQRSAAASLVEMSAAAKEDGIILTASSAYRSFDYQALVYERNVRQMGQEEADRESARPGFSQHQLGLAVDFGSITDVFAKTAEGQWLSANASRFGWSLSYPEGYEDITGYRWESWHYRYTGRETALFIDNYFKGIQQYAFRFLYEFKKQFDITDKERVYSQED